MVERHAAVQSPLRQGVKIPAQRIGNGLRLIVVIEARQIAPAGIAAQLDQARAEHHAEFHPAQDQKGKHVGRGCALAQKDRAEPGLEQHGFPTISVEDLPHIHERDVERPQRGPNGRGDAKAEAAGKAGERHQRERDAAPRNRRECRVFGEEIKQAGRIGERNLLDEVGNRQQPVFAEQRPELVQRHQECD